MNNWLFNALLMLVMWGLWAFLPKLAVKYIDPKSALIYQCIGSVLVGLVMLVMVDFKPQTHPKGMLYGGLTGILGFGGMLVYLITVSKVRVATVATLTALYPIVVIVLAYLILKEPITIKHVFGFGFGLLAITLLAT